MFVKRISLIVLASLISFFIFYVTAIDNFVNAYPDGISGYTGSPSTGGTNCSSCHLVSSISKTERIMLTNDIPVTGYLPDATYNFTLSFLSKQTRAGFNVRLENTEGKVAGLLTSLDTLSKTVDGELTHTFSSAIDNGKGQFKFTWTAPSTGDTVKLFAMAATSPRNGTLDTLNSFEYVFRSVLSTSLSFENTSTNRLAISYSQESLHFNYSLDRTSQVHMGLYDASGSLVKMIYEGMALQGEHKHFINTNSLKSGLYIMRFVNNGKITVKKVVIDG